MVYTWTPNFLQTYFVPLELSFYSKLSDVLGKVYKGQDDPDYYELVANRQKMSRKLFNQDRFLFEGERFSIQIHNP